MIRDDDFLNVPRQEMALRRAFSYSSTRNMQNYEKYVDCSFGVVALGSALDESNPIVFAAIMVLAPLARSQEQESSTTPATEEIPAQPESPIPIL